MHVGAWSMKRYKEERWLYGFDRTTPPKDAGMMISAQ